MMWWLLGIAEDSDLVLPLSARTGLVRMAPSDSLVCEESGEGTGHGYDNQSAAGYHL